MNILEHLLIAPDLFTLIKSGEKKVTVRFGERSIKTPESFQIISNENEADKVTVKLISIRYSTIADLTKNDLILAGKEKTPEEYLNKTLLRFYPDATLSDIVSIIQFELIKD